MKQPYEVLLAWAFLIALGVAITFLVVQVNPGFAVGYILWAIVFGVMLNDLKLLG